MSLDSSRAGPVRVMTLTRVGSATMFPSDSMAMASAASTAHAEMVDCIFWWSLPASDVIVAE